MCGALVLLGLLAPAAQAGIFARNQPDGRCQVEASLQGVAPWEARLQRNAGGTWKAVGKPFTWTAKRAIFACSVTRRAQIRVVGPDGSGALVVSSTIRQPAPITPQLRVIYATPKDRPGRQEFVDAIRSTASAVQGWYRTQLGGRTFKLSTRGVERCVLAHDAGYYRRRTYPKVLAELQKCRPVTLVSPGYTWMVYADLSTDCKAGDQLGVGAPGLAIFPREDLDGLTGQPTTDDCGEPTTAPVSRWVGGAAHELGHAFGLAHPASCVKGRSSCPSSTLMWLGYTDFPSTSLLPSERRKLIASPYFSRSN